MARLHRLHAGRHAQLAIGTRSGNRGSGRLFIEDLIAATCLTRSGEHDGTTRGNRLYEPSLAVDTAVRP